MINGYYNEDGIYTIEGTHEGFEEQLRYKRMKEKEGKTLEQVIFENTGVDVYKRTQPVTATGKALKVAGLPWLEEDFKAEAEEKGISVHDIPGYDSTMQPIDHANELQRNLNRVTGRMSELTQAQKRKLWNALADSGFNPSQED